MENKQLNNKDLLMTTKNVITKEKIMGIVSVVVMDVINNEIRPVEECSGKSSLTMPSTGRL